MHPSDLDLNDYADDMVTPADRTAIEEHLERCRDCRALVADLRELHGAAAGLEPMEPPAGAWSRLASAIRPEPSPAASHQSQVSSRQSAVVDSQQSPITSRQPRVASRQSSVASRRRLGIGDWRLMTVGAVAALILATAVGVGISYVARRGATAPAAPETAPDAQAVEAELLQAEQHYQKAISGLEQIANAETGALDPQTAATLQKSLAVVDRAIDESRGALKTQPGNEPAEQSLLDNFKTKISLLQDTVALINDMRNGNEAGAVRIVSGLQQRP